MPCANIRQSGWSPVGHFDAIGEGARCELPNCNRSLRWVHVLEHPKLSKRLHVGRFCAERLCDNYDATAVERKAQKWYQRWRRFMDRSKWKPSRRNPENIVRKVSTDTLGTVIVTVFVKNELYSVFLNPGKGKGNERCEWSNCSTQTAAMEIAFSMIEELIGNSE